MKIFLFIFICCFNIFAFENQKWEFMGDDDGVKVYHAHVSGRKIVALKGEIEINAPIDVITTFFYDTSKKHLWIAKLKDIKTIDRPAPYSLVEHYTIQTPFFLKNRDFVYRGDLVRNNDATLVEVLLKSVVHPKAPVRDGIVRGELVFGKYIIEKIMDNKTKLSVIVLADPKGAIPKWVVNLYQKSWPRKTLTRIKEIAMNGEMPIHPDITNFFK